MEVIIIIIRMPVIQIFESNYHFIHCRNIITSMWIFWVKVLVTINQRNQVIQARDATIDVEVENLDILITEII